MTTRRTDMVWTDINPGRDRGVWRTRAGEKMAREDEARSRWLTRTITVKGKRPAPPVVEVADG